MNKLIQCSKIESGRDTRLYIILTLLLCLVVTICNEKNNYFFHFIKYSSCVMVILIIIWDEFFRGKKADIEIEVDKLLKDYNKDKDEADKKYNGKYVRLVGRVSHIEFGEMKNIFISLESDDIYSIYGASGGASKKCIKYVENILRGQEITIYGNFIRNRNNLCLYIVYLK